VCTVGSTDFAVRSWVLVVLASRQQPPVVQEVGLVKLPVESVLVAGAAEQCYQVQGTGQVAGAGSAGGSGEALLQPPGSVLPVWLEAEVEEQVAVLHEQ